MRLASAMLIAAALVVAMQGCQKRPEPGAGGKPATAASGPAAAAGGANVPIESAVVDAQHAAKLRRAVGAGVAFLLKTQNADGGWGAPDRSHPGLTAMAIKCLVQLPDFRSDNPAVARGLDCLMKSRQPDGGFYVPGEGNYNYITSLAVMALAAAKDPRYGGELDGAVKYLRSQQIRPGGKTPAGESVDESDPYVGGVSYGKPGDNRPDLSNLGFWLEAMHESGVGGEDPDMQRALAFVKRVQNRTEGTAGQTFVVKGDDDGGFIYGIRKQDGQYVGESKAGDSDRGLRSYGSMTYTGFKSMLYANVAKDDPRVKAAFEWIRKYWRLDSNPNMPAKQSKEGLYYYYHVFAKALRTWGQDEIADSRDVKHNWRSELIDVLAGLQQPDGSWSNDRAERWEEGNPALATCYSLLALEEAARK